MRKKTRSALCYICKEEKPKTGACVVLPNKEIICEDCKKSANLKVFRIGCSWSVVGHYEIPAENIEQAIEIGKDPACSLPPDPDYVPGSFEVDPECCEELEGEEI